MAPELVAKSVAELRRGMDRPGEVGRSTFISGEARRGVAAPGEPRGIRIDFEFNYPMLPDQTALIAKSLDGVEKPAALDAALRQATSQEEHPAFDRSSSTRGQSFCGRRLLGSQPGSSMCRGA